jgi:hypothetical protein
MGVYHCRFLVTFFLALTDSKGAAYCKNLGMMYWLCCWSSYLWMGRANEGCFLWRTLYYYVCLIMYMYRSKIFDRCIFTVHITVMFDFYMLLEHNKTWSSWSEISWISSTSFKSLSVIEAKFKCLFFCQRRNYIPLSDVSKYYINLTITSAEKSDSYLLFWWWCKEARWSSA